MKSSGEEKLHFKSGFKINFLLERKFWSEQKLKAKENLLIEDCIPDYHLYTLVQVIKIAKKIVKVYSGRLSRI